MAQDLEAATVQAALDDPHRPIARNFEIYEQYCEGEKSVRELAAEWHLSKSYINDICRAVETWLASKFIMEIRQLRARISQRLDLVFQKSMRGFEESRRDEVTITTTTDEEGYTKTTEQRRGQAGCPAFLAQAKESMKELAELWGAKAPNKVKVEISEVMRVGGRSPEEALKMRLGHLKSLLTPHDN